METSTPTPSETELQLLERPGPKQYTVNDIFYSLQGEGVRAGQPSVFVRFSGCNLMCAGETVGEALQPVCDTEFVSGVKMTADQIVERCLELGGECPWIIFTGGEPALQLDQPLCDAMRAHGYRLAIETNGTINVDPLKLDWVCVSPKVAEHAIQQRKADEVKYVRGYGQGIPKTQVKADHHLISPAFVGMVVSSNTLRWCINLCLENPRWRLTMQLHKILVIP